MVIDKIIDNSNIIVNGNLYTAVEDNIGGFHGDCHKCDLNGDLCPETMSCSGIHWELIDKNKYKQMLLIALSSYLPYGLKYSVLPYDYPKVNQKAKEPVVDTMVAISNRKSDRFNGIFIDAQSRGWDAIETVRPYLRPMSSMTDEETKFYTSFFSDTTCICDYMTIIDWLNAHHFDYRGLIEKGLALPAKENMYND